MDLIQITSIVGYVAVFAALWFFSSPTNKYKLLVKKYLSKGIETPFQRIGFIILLIGIVSLFSWMVERGISFSYLLEPYYLPSSIDSLFFHLFLYLIPLGLLMSWGYGILLFIKIWIFKNQAR